jgi:hypothetical protein
VRQIGPPSAAGNWARAGTPLLDDKRGVPVARPQVEVGDEREAEDKK